MPFDCLKRLSHNVGACLLTMLRVGPLMEDAFVTCSQEFCVAFPFGGVIGQVLRHVMGHRLGKGD